MRPKVLPSIYLGANSQFFISQFLPRRRFGAPIDMGRGIRSLKMIVILFPVLLPRNERISGMHR